jgi:uncharacterized SAM-binding protein YcdF (DUF218 family)
MVMLMGSIPDRVLQVSDLYNKRLADKVIIVQESNGSSKELEIRGVHLISSTKQCKDALITLGIPDENIIILPGDARSTQQEATILRDYLKTHPEIDTLTLVSSSDHTRRASMIFEKALNQKGMSVVILCSPSKYTGYTGQGWWKDKEGIQTVLMEYIKMFNFWMFEGKRL